MSTYRRYQQARDAAWRALLHVREKRFPVDAEALARQLGVDVHPFPGADEAKLSRCIQLAGGGDCVSLRIRGQWHIFLRTGRLDENQQRFSIAHELGHLLLDHGTRSLMPGVRAFAGRENQGDLIEDPQNLDDYAADIFAIRLLAPACVLHELHIDQSGQIMALCGLPPRAAALRAERMGLLNLRNVFYNHPLERQVRDQFLPFIRERQKAVAAPTEIGSPARSVVMAPLLPCRAETDEAQAASPAGAPGAEPESADPDASDAPAVPEDGEGTAGTGPSPRRDRGLWLWVLPLALAAGAAIYFLCRGG